MYPSEGSSNFLVMMLLGVSVVNPLPLQRFAGPAVLFEVKGHSSGKTIQEDTSTHPLVISSSLDESAQLCWLHFMP